MTSWECYENHEKVVLYEIYREISLIKCGNTFDHWLYMSTATSGAKMYSRSVSAT